MLTVEDDSPGVATEDRDKKIDAALRLDESRIHASGARRARFSDR